MDMRDLEYFLTVAEEGSVTRAAELLHISQPTVSRQLMALEEELGRTLLLRTKRSVSLTPDGLLFRETAREMLALYQKAAGERAEEEALAGDVYLGTGETESFAMVAGEIRRFQAEHPAVRFHVISENADRICEDVEKGLLDVGFVLRSPDPARFESHVLCEEGPWGVLLPKEHPLAGRERLRPEELRGERLVLPENRLLQGDVRRWLGDSAEGAVACTSNLIHNSLVMTEHGIGLTVSLFHREQERAGLAFVPLEGMGSVPSTMIWKRRPVRPAAAARFIRQIIDAKTE